MCLVIACDHQLFYLCIFEEGQRLKLAQFRDYATHSTDLHRILWTNNHNSDGSAGLTEVVRW